MDKAAERLSEWFGSVPFILLHVAWWVAWLALGKDLEMLITIVSLEAILLSLLILRAENVAQTRFEEQIKRDITKSNEQLKLLNAIIKEQKEQRFQR